MRCAPTPRARLGKARGLCDFEGDAEPFESAGVQEAGCGALCILAENDGIKTKIASAGIGGIEVVLKAMREHPRGSSSAGARLRSVGEPG